MRLRNSRALKTFVTECDDELFSDATIIEVSYAAKSTRRWNAKAITSDNDTLLGDIGGDANIYAIFTLGSDGEPWKLRYIGQTKAKLARTRLRNHLIKKNRKTGSKLDKVKKHVKNGGAVAVSWISIDPETLRHYVEAMLIKGHPEADWNIQGR